MFINLNVIVTALRALTARAIEARSGDLRFEIGDVSFVVRTSVLYKVRSQVRSQVRSAEILHHSQEPIGTPVLASIEPPKI